MKVILYLDSFFRHNSMIQAGNEVMENTTYEMTVLKTANNIKIVP